MLKGAMGILIVAMLMTQNSKALDKTTIEKVEENITANIEEVQNIAKKEEQNGAETKENTEEKIKHATPENFEEEVLKSKKVVLVDFYATWCSPCQKLSPVLEKLAEENIDFKIIKVNEADSKELLTKYDIKGYPTLLIIKNGEEKERILGGRDIEELKEIMKKHIEK